MAWRVLAKKTYENANLLKQNNLYYFKKIIVDCATVKNSNSRVFHNSPHRQALPPIIVLALRPILKISAMLFGRSIRKWWQKMPPDKKEQILSQVRKRMKYISAGFTVLSGAGFIFYIEHIEEHPITKRKRFILYNDEQMNEIANYEFDLVVAENKRDIFPPSHPIYQRVVRVASRILEANSFLSEVSQRKWFVTVVDRPDVTNAFVLPNGKIVLYTGILNVASNEDQLAIVLSHEISHALLQHMTENLSKAIFIEMILIIPIVVVWATLPDVAALFTQWLQSRLADVMVNLPFSRYIEKEADVVGLELAARACYDVREAPVFWGKMVQVASNDEPLEWLSTHPSNETRQLDLSNLIPAALKVRDDCKCPRLPPTSMAQRFFSQGKLT